MRTVNADLYDLLKECETGLYRRKSEIVAYAHIPYYQLGEFVEAIGCGWFDEGGIDCKLFEGTICVELNDIFDAFDNTIFDYKTCFSDSDIEYYKEEITRMYL